MRPSRVAANLERAIEAGIAAMIWGSPGIGKSDIVYQLTRRRSIGIIDQRLSQLDPVDLRGVPSVVNKMTLWNTPQFLPQVERDGPEGILFLDEINSAAQSTQAAAYQLVLDRRLGDYQLPDGWAVVAAGNDEGDRAIVNKMSTALRNRFIHLPMEVSVDDWRAWALAAGIRDEVLGFIAFRSGLLNEFGSEQARNQKAFATPRSWEFVSRSMHDNPDYELELEFYSGVVGKGPAAEFLGYLKFHRTLPNIDALLLNPGKAPVPKEPATLWAMATTLAARATPDNFEAVTAYLARISAEYGVLCVKDAVTRDETLTDTKAFTDWSVRNGQLMT